MHSIHRLWCVCHKLGIVALALLLLRCSFGSAATSDRDIWQNYTTGQKQLAISGLTDCYRSASPDKHSFANRDLTATVQIVDQSSHGGENAPFGSIILQSIRKAPIVKPNPHAEHWEGPTGFHSGLWWRGIDDPDRRAYVQGVFWCVHVAKTIEIDFSRQSVQQVVKKLDDWYIISDDDWKDPDSNARVDISIISALQRIGILHLHQPKVKELQGQGLSSGTMISSHGSTSDPLSRSPHPNGI